MNAFPPPLFRRWVLHCAAGELLGIGTAGALAATYLLRWGEPQSVPERLGFLGLMLAAGSLEGYLLGWFQARVLREVMPGLSVRRWIGLTILIAFFGWLAGMLPSTSGLVGGTLAGLSLGVATGWFLKRMLPEVPASSVA